MKKLFIVLCCASVLALFGCGDKGLSPEEIAQKQVVEAFKGLNCDLGKLKYDVEEEEDTAVVKVSGKVIFQDEIKLMKKDNAWVLASEVMIPAAEVAPEKAEEKPAH